MADTTVWHINADEQVAFDFSWGDSLLEYSSVLFGNQLNVGFMGSNQNATEKTNNSLHVDE